MLLPTALCKGPQWRTTHLMPLYHGIGTLKGQTAKRGGRQSEFLCTEFELEVPSPSGLDLKLGSHNREHCSGGSMGLVHTEASWHR